MAQLKRNRQLPGPETDESTAQEADISTPPPKVETAPIAVPPDATDGDFETRPNRTGVLFVHGMGSQKPGDTLLTYGEPVVEWVKRWATRDFAEGATSAYRLNMLDGVQPVERSVPQQIAQGLPDITLLPSANLRGNVRADNGFKPPYSMVGLQRTSTLANGETTTEVAEWLMAEAWWADEALAPDLPDVAKWGLGIAPSLIVQHFAGDPQTIWGVVRQSVRFAFALVVMVAFQVLVCLLLLVAAIPFLRDRIRGIILILVASLGDVMTYVSSPQRASAIRATVQRSLDWLRESNCSRIAIVSHSLGTVVSYDLLNKDSENVERFVTFGSALRKSNVSLHAQQNALRLSLGIVLATIGTTSLTVAAGLGLWSNDGVGNNGLAVIFAWPGIDAFRDRFPSALGDLLTSEGARQALVVMGALFVMARYALWFPEAHWLTRLIAPFGGLIGAIGVAIIIAAQDPGSTILHGMGLAGFGAVTILAIGREFWSWKLRFTHRRSAGSQEKTQPIPRLFDAWVIQSLLVLSVVFSIVIWGDHQSLSPALIVIGIWACFSAIKVPFGGVVPDNRPAFQIERELIRSSPLRWIDLWASADAVPGESMQDLFDSSAGRGIDGQSSKIRNRRSVFHDHTTYHENQEQFVAQVASTLTELSGWGGLVPNLNRDQEPGGWWESLKISFPHDSDAAYGTACRRRVSRVRWLALAQVVVFGLLPFVILMTGWSTLTQAGQHLFNPFQQALESVVGERVVNSVQKWVPLSNELMGVLLMFAGVYLWYRLAVFQAWRQWDKAEASAMFRRYSVASQAMTRWRALAFLSVAFVVPSIVAVILLGGQMKI